MAGRDPRRRFQAAVAHPTVTDHGNVIQLRAAEVAARPRSRRLLRPPISTRPRPRRCSGGRSSRSRCAGPTSAARSRQQAGLRWHQARYHGLRSPFYLLTYAWHAVRGSARLTARAGLVALDRRLAAGIPGRRRWPRRASRGAARAHRGQEDQGGPRPDRRRLRGPGDRRRASWRCCSRRSGRWRCSRSPRSRCSPARAARTGVR